MAHRVAQRVAVVTGTTTGIGLEVALQLSQKDYIVVATKRPSSTSPPSLEASCDVQSLDVSDDENAQRLANYVKERYGRCDVLINNAGFAIIGSLESMSIESAKRVFEVNVWGVMRMSKLLVPLMRDAGGGLVITVSSTSGLRGLPCADVYTASKMAVQGMMDSFRYSVDQDNIKVAIVNPGPTDSAFYDRSSKEKAAIAVEGPHPKLMHHYAELVGTRNKVGQPAAECAESIVEVVEREIVKDLRKGDEVYFMNGTSDYAKGIINRMLCSPDGHSGEYAGIYTAARAAVAKLNAEEE